MQKRFTRLSFGLLFVLLLPMSSSFAQILSYTTSTTGSLASVATHATGTALSRVNGATAPGSPCGTGFSSATFPSSTSYSSTGAAIEVTVTAATGYALSVTGFSADMRRSSTGPASVRYAYSTDGGTTWTSQSSNQTPNNAACATTTTGTWTTSISLNAPNTLKFRVYGFNASSTAGTFQILNLTILGTVTATCIVPSLATSVTNVSCSGGATGAVTLTPTGGTSPFTYAWSNSATTQNLSNVTANTYTVTVTATGGCTTTASATVTQPTALTATISTQTNTGCGGTDGQATVLPAGGTSPYTYSWTTSPVQTTATANTLSPTSYIATIKDAHNCSATATATITILALGGQSATNITTTAATLNWTDAYSSASYKVQYRKTGTTTWTSATSAVTTLAISGLTAGTTYEFQVQAVCTGGATGPFSSSFTFTTQGNVSCGVATGLGSGSITTSGATLSWTPVSGALSYNIQYRPTGTGTWSTTTSASASVAVSGLTSGTAYEFQVQTICSGSSSSYSASGNFTTTSGSTCDASLWNHVYNSTRLIVNQQCITVTGTVANKITEADGDIHIRVTIDPAYQYMINSANVSGQHGDLVVEPLCVANVTQTDAIASCTGYTNTVYIPNVGERVQITGSYVTDNNHGWNEIHPVTSITIFNGKTNTTTDIEGVALADEDIRVFPNPNKGDLFFDLQKKPSSVVYVIIVDGLGRVAGQYQMLETHQLQVDTRWLPAGTYYYNILQNDKTIKKGAVIVQHDAE